MKGFPPALKKALKAQDKRLPDALKRVIEARSEEKQHKYGAKRTTCLYGHPHDSRKEAMWCIKLNELQKEGKIRNLSVEPIYDLRVNGTVVCTHMPDFDYEILRNAFWVVEVLDVKGLLLPEWKLKHKLFKAIYTEINYVVV